MYRIRCTVSGGLEEFAEKEVSQILLVKEAAGPSLCFGDISISWNQRGHSGSQLDIIIGNQSRSEFLQGTLPLLVRNLHFVDHVALRVLSDDVTLETATTEVLLNHVTERCFQLDKGILDTALEAWSICKSILDTNMPTSMHDLDGELLSFPTNLSQDCSSQPAFETKRFHVNTIYTKPHVAKAVVQTFVDLVQKELEKGDEILWLDAGAGSGSLLQELPKDASIGVDLNPQHESVYEKDFFDVSVDWLLSHHRPFQHLCVISNPPFVQDNRGDYSIIAKFLEHAMQHLGARFMGLIAPVKFVHVWKSFGRLPIQLRYRLHLPQDSFFDPSTAESKHVKCYLLIFDLQTTAIPPKAVTDKLPEQSNPTRQFHIISQRDKGLFPTITTSSFTSAVVNGLGRAGVPLGPSNESSIIVKAKLAQKLELFLELNPKRPLSLANSMSSRVENHSLGWMSKSVKPSVALAMHSLARVGPTNQARPSPLTGSFVVNLMCGEGTLELESINANSVVSSFQLAGDKNPDAVSQTAANMSKLSHQAPAVMDFIIWDAQHLPLRSGITDVLLGDLPFAGSNKKIHQEPSVVLKADPAPSLNYFKVLAEVIRVLSPSSGQAVFVSPDSKTLSSTIRTRLGLLKELWQTKVNVGGLPGKMSLLLRKGCCWKDLNLLVQIADVNHSSQILERSRQACHHFCLDKSFQLHEDGKLQQQLISKVHLREVYHHQSNDTISQCYRITFDASVSNTQAKTMERAFRFDLQMNPIAGTKLA